MANEPKDEIIQHRQLADEELEKDVVGYLLGVSYNQLQEVRNLLETKNFYYDTPRNLYRVICYLNDQGETADASKVMPELMKRNLMTMDVFAKDYISRQGCYVSYLELLKHVDILVDYARRRELFIVANEAISEGTTVNSDLVTAGENFKKKIDEIIYSGKSIEAVTMTDLIKDINQTISENMAGLSEKKITKTGFQFLDNVGGLTSGDLDIVAAESSVGKSSFGISLIIKVIENGKKVVFFSTEMQSKQIVARFLSYYTKLRSWEMLNKPLTDIQLNQFDEGVGSVMNFSDNLLFNSKNSSNIDDIIKTIRKQKQQNNISGAVVDFIQRLTGRYRGEGDDDFYRRVSQKLKDLALELDIWIVLMSQLNRETDKNLPENTRYIPTMNRLRGSGQIAEAADNIWFIYRPDYYNKEYGKSIIYPSPYETVVTEGTAMIIQAKGRNVGTGKFIVGFKAECTHFYDLGDNIPYRDAAGRSLQKQQTEITGEAPAELGDMPF